MEELFHTWFIVCPGVHEKGVVWNSVPFSTNTEFFMVTDSQVPFRDCVTCGAHQFALDQRVTTSDHGFKGKCAQNS